MRRAVLASALALAACADAPDPSSTPSTDPPAEASRPAVGEVATPADSGAVAPRLAVGIDGTLVLSWAEPDGSGHALRYARWTGAGWSEAETADSGTGLVVNGSDTPGVVPLRDGLLAHALLAHAGASHAYDATVRQSSADGPWDAADLLNTDGVAAEHGFVSAVPRADGGADVVWLDGRQQGAGHGHHAGAMTLRAVTLDSDGARRDETELDARTCDCCPTAAAATASGLVVAYRDRSEAEIRDVAVVRRVDGVWTEPMIPHADGWHIEGCPVNGPALASRGDRVALAWFTAAGDTSRVWLAVSEDGGATWGERERIDGGSPIGRVGVAMLDDGSPVVSWLEGVGDAAEVRVRRVGGAGDRNASQTVATVDAGRSSGIPRVAALGDRALVAWTDASSVRTAVVAP